MRVVIDIPDETFARFLGTICCRGRVARYLRRVSEVLDSSPCSDESSGTVALDPRLASPDHTAGWACEGAPWQRVEVEQ